MKQNLRWLFLSLLVGLTFKSYSQLAYNEDFNDIDTVEWTDGDFYWLDDYESCSGYSVVGNIYYGNSDPGISVSPLIGVSNGDEAQLSYSYKLLDYWSYEAYPNDTDWGSFSVEYSNSPTGPWTVIETVGQAQHVESATCVTRTVNFTPAAGDVYLRVVAVANEDEFTDALLFFDDVSVIQTSCTSTPDVPVVTALNPGVCLSQPAVVSIPNPGVLGLSYQWQVSTNGTDFTDVAANGNGLTYSAVQAETTWYRVMVTCEDSGEEVTSEPVMVLSSGLECLCDIEFDGAVEPITYVGFAGIDNQSSAEVDGSPGVENFTYLAPAEVTAGETYTLTLEGNTNGVYDTPFTIYIDFNHNGVMDDDGEVFEGGIVSDSDGEDGQQAVTEIEIPLTAMEGLTQMRILKLFDEYSTDPCSSDDGVGYGQAEDYLINITLPEMLDYVNLQWPPTMDLEVGETGTVYAQAWEDGVTPGAGAGEGVTAWIGINDEDTDPATWTTWIPATYNNTATGNNDEFMAEIGAELEPGTYYYASRFTLNDGPYTYGGYTPEGGGYWDGTVNVSGVLTVTCDTQAPVADATQAFCEGATVAELTAEGSVIVWYADATGGEPLESTAMLQNDTTYYAALLPDGGCESEARTAVAVTVNEVDAPDADDVQDFCLNATVADLEAEGDVVWYADATGGTPLDMGVALTNGTVYYAAGIDGDCESTSRTMVTATINIIDAPIAPAAQTVCNGSELEELEATATGDVVWYESAAGGEQLDPETLLTDGTTYYAATLDGDCESAGRTGVTVTLNIVAAPTGEAVQSFNSSISFDDIDISATGELEWYASEEDALNDENDLDENDEIIETQTFYVTQEIDGCVSEPFAVTVEIMLGTEGFTSGSFTYHPNPVKDVLNLSYSNGIDKAEVYNLLGQAVLVKAGGYNDMQLDMSQLSAGTYMVKLYSAGTSKTVKVIKQ